MTNNSVSPCFRSTSCRATPPSSRCSPRSPQRRFDCCTATRGCRPTLAPLTTCFDYVAGKTVCAKRRLGLQARKLWKTRRNETLQIRGVTNMAPVWLFTYISGVAKLRLFELSEKLYICLYFLFLLQTVEILWNGSVVASVPHSMAFASRSKKNYDVTEA